MRAGFKIKIITFLFLSFFWQDVVLGAKINSILIHGLRRVDEYAVLSRLSFSVGEDVKENQINNSIKSLYLSQYFSKISMDIENGVLNIHVIENPVVNDVLFGGIAKKYADQIKEEILIQPRGIYTRDKVKSDTEKIKIIFQKIGRLSVDVIPKIEFLERNRVNVLFEIVDGAISRVDSVFLIGNRNISRNSILSSLSNKGSRSIFRGKVFEEDALDVDAARIIQMYTNSGFPYAAINYVVSEYERMTHNFDVTYDIIEGDKYYISNVSIVSDIPGIDLTELKNNIIKIHPRDIFRQSNIENTSIGISEYLSNIGYAFVQVEPLIQHDEETHTSDIRFVIKKANHVHIGTINVVGTKRSVDSTVRGELLMQEGDLYNRGLIRRSKIKLQMLGYFDIIEIKEKQGQKPNTVDLDVIVRDLKQTGNVSFSIGYSTFESLILNVGASKNNIAGLGYTGSFSAILSLWRRTISIGFSKPRFLGTNLNFGFDITYNNIAPIGAESGLLPSLLTNLFNQNSIVVALRLGYPITSRLFHSWALQYRFDDLSFQSTSGSQVNTASLYRDQVTQKQMSTSISHTLSYDKRDNHILPTKGYFASLTQTLGLPMPYQLNYESNDFFGGIYIPLSKNRAWVLSIIAKGGAIFGYNDSIIPFQYRYSLGYYNMRGFYFSGVGPHSVSQVVDENGNPQGDPVGTASIGLRGNYYYVASFEARMPTPLPKEYGLNIVAFMDIGSSFGISGVPLSVKESLADGKYVQPAHDPQHPKWNKVEYVEDVITPRIAIGAGLLYMSPIGPIRIEFAAAVLKAAFDTPLVVRIHFSGTPI